MANITYSSGASDFGGGFRRRLHRGLAAVRREILDLQWELAEQHRQFQLDTALRSLDVPLLRDIGLDRSAC
jgi:hypothetical protein